MLLKSVIRIPREPDVDELAETKLHEHLHNTERDEQVDTGKNEPDDYVETIRELPNLGHAVPQIDEHQPAADCRHKISQGPRPDENRDGKIRVQVRVRYVQARRNDEQRRREVPKMLEQRINKFVRAKYTSLRR